MCGIVGYIGNRRACDVLINGLSKLEYRGYDSVGISLFKDTHIVTEKTQGRIADMVKKVDFEIYKDIQIGRAHV